MRIFAAAATVLAALAVAGCGDGGDGDSEASADDGSSGTGTVIAALGDSITAGNPNFDPDPAARAAYGFGDDEQSQYEYWAAKASKEPLEIRNCGVFGERTDEIASRFGACTEGADGVIVQGGINDIAQRYDVDRAADNLQAIVQEAKRRDLPVAITDVLPWNNGYPMFDPQIRALNLLIADIAEEEAIPMLPFHDTLEDPKAPGRMKEELTSDGDHPSVEGYRLLGERAFKLPQ